MDASVFPTASGANPMVTTLAISHMLSHRLLNRLHKEQGKNVSSKDKENMMEARTNRRSHALKKQKAVQMYKHVQFYLLTPMFLTATLSALVKVSKQFNL